MAIRLLTAAGARLLPDPSRHKTHHRKWLPLLMSTHSACKLLITQDRVSYWPLSKLPIVKG